MPAVWLKPSKEKSVHHRHPWIFSGAIARLDNGVPPGAIVEVLDAAGNWLARGYLNPHSQIVVRLLTWDESEPIDRAFWESRLRHAWQRREALQLNASTNA